MIRYRRHLEWLAWPKRNRWINSRVLTHKNTHKQQKDMSYTLSKDVDSNIWHHKQILYIFFTAGGEPRAISCKRGFASKNGTTTLYVQSRGSMLLKPIPTCTRVLQTNDAKTLFTKINWNEVSDMWDFPRNKHKNENFLILSWEQNTLYEWAETEVACWEFVLFFFFFCHWTQNIQQAALKFFWFYMECSSNYTNLEQQRKEIFNIVRQIEVHVRLILMWQWHVTRKGKPCPKTEILIISFDEKKGLHIKIYLSALLCAIISWIMTCINAHMYICKRKTSNVPLFDHLLSIDVKRNLFSKVGTCKPNQTQKLTMEGKSIKNVGMSWTVATPNQQCRRANHS